MTPFLELLGNAFSQTLVSIAHNWPYLLVSIAVAAALKAFVTADRTAAFLGRWKGAGVIAATGAAVATPFCSCGTTAIILGMMAGAMPLAPIVAFMVSSPLSSPEEVFYSAGLFGWPFALFHFASSIVLGLAGGGIAAMLEKRGYLAGQTRFTNKTDGAAATADGAAATAGGCSCASSSTRDHAGLPAAAGLAAAPQARPSSRLARPLGEWAKAAVDVAGKLLPMFIGFAYVGYLLNGLIPPDWISALFGSGKAYGVPLAATIGLPLYVSSEASLPLVRALLDSGMSQGAIMAFLIAGSGTSIGAITGALTIARWKVVGLVVAVLWIGAIAAGYGFDVLVLAGLA